jgi:membrane-associated phospholipid phosphatase
MWLAYMILSRNKGSDELLRFLQLAATTVPVSYLLKTFLQFAFGRTNTRLWLAGDMPLQFNWFHGAGIGCFPSGHMTVFTAFGVAIWYTYPRHRRLTALGLVLLGVALIITDYHFLSDVIAGVYIALLLDYGVRHLLKRYGAKNWIVK